MTFRQMIIKLRATAGMSQQEVADGIGLARATYAGLETGRREPNLAEIRAIGELYQVAPSDLINGTVPQAEEPIVAHDFADYGDDIEPREINPEMKPEKLRQVLLYVLDKVGAKPNVGETVLYKLLYFIDFDYYEKHGKSITGLTYVRNHFGPTPAKSFVEVVEGMRKSGELEIVETRFFNNLQKKYLPTKSSELKGLSANELDHINEELARLGDKTATELSELSHKDTPWRVAQQGKPIDYQFVFYRTDLTAVTEPRDEL